MVIDISEVSGIFANLGSIVVAGFILLLVLSGA